MKRALIPRLVVTFLVVLPSCVAWLPNVAQADLVAQISFDDSAGSIRGTVGTFEGDAKLTTGNGGINGEALVLDGTGDYVSFSGALPGQPVLGSLTSVSISLWVNTPVNNDLYDRLVAVFRENEDDFRFGNFEVAHVRLSQTIRDSKHRIFCRATDSTLGQHLV